MTTGDWLEARLSGVPAPLAARLRELMAPAWSDPVEGFPERAIAAAGSTVATLIRDDCTGRESALDLLCADALATFALEAAADDPGRLAERARWALARLAGVAGDEAPEGRA